MAPVCHSTRRSVTSSGRISTSTATVRPYFATRYFVVRPSAGVFTAARMRPVTIMQLDAANITLKKSSSIIGIIIG